MLTIYKWKIPDRGLALVALAILSGGHSAIGAEVDFQNVPVYVSAWTADDHVSKEKAAAIDEAMPIALDVIWQWMGPKLNNARNESSYALVKTFSLPGNEYAAIQLGICGVNRDIAFYTAKLQEPYNRGAKENLERDHGKLKILQRALDVPLLPTSPDDTAISATAASATEPAAIKP
jgi:hypothetical protein